MKLWQLNRKKTQPNHSKRCLKLRLEQQTTLFLDLDVHLFLDNLVQLSLLGLPQLHPEGQSRLVVDLLRQLGDQQLELQLAHFYHYEETDQMRSSLEETYLDNQNQNLKKKLKRTNRK